MEHNVKLKTSDINFIISTLNEIDDVRKPIVDIIIKKLNNALEENINK